jgi:hypothetical protein
VTSALATVIWGYLSTKFRTIREPLFAGFLIYTAGTIGFATIQPGQSTRSLIFSAVSGIGFGAPLILLVTGVQLSTPPLLMATATAVITSSRAVAATVFVPILSAAFHSRLSKDTPNYISQAVLPAGLPRSSLPSFMTSLTGGSTAALGKVPGVSPQIIALGTTALKQAYADSVRVVFIIAAPFGVLACIACFFLGDLRKTMNYSVDAPVEHLHPRNGHRQEISTA